MTRYPADEWVADHIRTERLRAEQAADLFVQAAAKGDVKGFLAACDVLSEDVVGGGWTLAFKRAAKLSDVPQRTKQKFFRVWVESKSIARHIDHDFIAIDGLRTLLPAYSGPEVRLFRGECFSNRKRRTYGISWTADISVAERFATDARQMSEGGSTILETIAPSAAIIATTNAIGDHYNEFEYLVDRRKLNQVSVVRRFPQSPMPNYAPAKIRILGSI